MYEAHWGLKEKPFENTADPRFLYKSPQHEEALTRLQYVISEDKGLGLLTGVFGCGKTLIAEKILETLSSGAYEVAMVVNPQLSAKELLRDIIYNLGLKQNISHDKDEIIHILVEALQNNFKNGKRSIVIIDEAHLIKEVEIFEELRVLLNYQSKHHFLLTLLLFGQPELKEMISNIKQFSQRVAIRHHLVGLEKEEVPQYVKHRLEVAGAEKPIFSDDTYNYIATQTGGIPRRINHLCDLSLLTGYCEGIKEIDKKVLEAAARDMED